MPPHQLLDDPRGDVVYREWLVGVLTGHARMEHDLEQQVAELLAQVVAVAALDRLDRLVRLLDQIADERLVRLLSVPRALAAQPVHDLDEVEQPRSDRVVRAEHDLDLWAAVGAGAVPFGACDDVVGELPPDEDGVAVAPE